MSQYKQAYDREQYQRTLITDLRNSVTQASKRIKELEAGADLATKILVNHIKELEAELKLCHKIIKHGPNTGDEMAYVFDIEQGVDV